jgi:hypothetical protein
VSLGLHQKQTLVTATQAEYLHRWPELTGKTINQHIGVECATKIGHMWQSPSGARSTATQTKCGQTAKILYVLELGACCDIC